jgi:hypothetical protein
MAQNKVYKFPTTDKLTAFLNGAVFGNNVQNTIGSGGGGTQAPALGPGLGGLVGLTFKTKAPGPAGTCTFAASNTGSGSGVTPGTNPDPNTLLFKDIKAQIEAAIAGVTVSMATGVLQVIETTPTNGVTVDHTGTASTILGFDGNNDTVGKLYTPVEVTPTAPCWTWSDTDNNGMLVIFTWE